MIKFNSRQFEEADRKTISSLLKEKEQVISAKMSRLNLLDKDEEFIFHYAFLRCSLDVIEFIRYYSCVDSETQNRRNYLCLEQISKPLRYRDFKNMTKKVIENLLRKDPRNSERYNSTIFTTLHLLNKIEFED